jgi:hypothetical protein
MADVTPQTAHQPTSTNEPPDGGILALQREIDALWRETNSPKIGLFRMTAIYRRLAEIRANLAQLENSQP